MTTRHVVPQSMQRQVWPGSSGDGGRTRVDPQDGQTGTWRIGPSGSSALIRRSTSALGARRPCAKSRRRPGEAPQPSPGRDERLGASEDRRPRWLRTSDGRARSAHGRAQPTSGGSPGNGSPCAQVPTSRGSRHGRRARRRWSRLLRSCRVPGDPLAADAHEARPAPLLAAKAPRPVRTDGAVLALRRRAAEVAPLIVEAGSRSGGHAASSRRCTSTRTSSPSIRSSSPSAHAQIAADHNSCG